MARDIGFEAAYEDMVIKLGGCYSSYHALREAIKARQATFAD